MWKKGYFAPDEQLPQSLAVWVRETASDVELPVGDLVAALLSSFVLQGNYWITAHE